MRLEEFGWIEGDVIMRSWLGVEFLHLFGRCYASTRGETGISVALDCQRELEGFLGEELEFGDSRGVDARDAAGYGRSAGQWAVQSDSNYVWRFEV